MDEVKITLKTIGNLLRYGLSLEYHLKKKDKYDLKHKTVLKYHLEKAEYYYEKIYGERK